MDAGWAFARHPDRDRFACVDNRCVIPSRVPDMGLALAVSGECSARYLRTVDQARYRRDAGLPTTASKAAQRTGANQRGAETTLARCVARNWCASRAGCLLLAGRGFFTELSGDGPRLTQA